MVRTVIGLRYIQLNTRYVSIKAQNEIAIFTFTEMKTNSLRI